MLRITVTVGYLSTQRIGRQKLKKKWWIVFYFRFGKRVSQCQTVWLGQDLLPLSVLCPYRLLMIEMYKVASGSGRVKYQSPVTSGVWLGWVKRGKIRSDSDYSWNIWHCRDTGNTNRDIHYTYHSTMDTEIYIPWYRGYRDKHGTMET